MFETRHCDGYKVKYAINNYKFPCVTVANKYYSRCALYVLRHAKTTQTTSRWKHGVLTCNEINGVT